MLRKWLSESGFVGPQSLTREAVLGYPKWRSAQGGTRNTALNELKILARIMDEALRRGYVTANAARNLRLSYDAAKEKRAFTDAELARIDQTLTAKDRFGWMRCTFLLASMLSRLQ